MDKIKIESVDAPEAVGPYAQAVKAGGLIFASGQIPLNPADGELVGADVEAQTRRVLANLREVLAAGGVSLSAVVKTTVFLTDLADFAAMNKVYAEFFSAPFPARSTIQVAALPKGARVEIEAVAVAG
ncbi:MAG: RidA family protein [Verrucomicrobiales bacterium]|jgi:2-iminobutanoate/2-iminopropanoate deaminase|nr:RidA family protein [Verrucomicrobiales bacterium]